MNRREVIQKSMLALGFAISAPALSGILNGCKAKPELTYQPVFFDEDQARLVAEVAEIIIPRTTTPGAKDVGVPSFIDTMLKEAYSAEQQQKFKEDLAGFDEEAKKQYGSRFLDCDPQQQAEFVKKQNELALTSGLSISEGWWAAGKGNDRPFILKMKELTLLGFFTSEPGATQVLQYNQVPGPFKGCVPLTEVGKSWAT
jgi:gluconate 2-dehydrogenase gamma chain